MSMCIASTVAAQFPQVLIHGAAAGGNCVKKTASG